jgi:uncharacterized membrane protein
MPNKAFLTEQQEQRVVKAIARAENRTSGEVRVHIEHQCSIEPLERAAAVFHDLGMDETEQQNGVIIYIASDDHKAAIFAGKGIHEQVEDHFWNDVLQILLNHFKKGEYEIGIEEAVVKVGHKLQELYPYQRGDVNELPDEISYNENQDD